MKKYSLFLILGTLLLMVISCKKLDGCKDEPLSLQKVNHTSDLRIDGFYYGDSSIDSKGQISIEMIFFYNNGFALYPGYPDYSKMNDYANQTVSNPPTRTMYAWGLFKQLSNNIEVEKWLPRPCGLWVEYRSGKVLNDTTFELTYQKQSYKGEKSSGVINQIYHFRAFSPKPDSTNDFIQ